jgi:hypothetical protein
MLIRKLLYVYQQLYARRLILRNSRNFLTFLGGRKNGRNSRSEDHLKQHLTLEGDNILLYYEVSELVTSTYDTRCLSIHAVSITRAVSMRWL